MAGDSAVTSRSLRAFNFPDRRRTSFGERQGQMDSATRRYVLEEGHKLSVGDNFVTAIAGDMATAESILETFRTAYVGGSDPCDAAQNALRSSGPFSTDATVLIGTYFNDRPVLLRVDTIPESVTEIDGLVQIGSDLPDQHAWTSKLVTGLLPHVEKLKGPETIHAERCFSQIIGLLQSYVIHDYLLERGAGGAFVGAWITEAGARWQGDHLFVVHGDKPDPDNLILCGTFIRDSSICLVTNQDENVQISRGRFKRKSTDSVRASPMDMAIGDFDCGSFDYFISINSQKHIVTIIEMNRFRHHRLVSICPQSGRGTLGIIWTERLLEIVKTFAGVEKPDGQELTLGFLTFSPIPEDEASMRDKFAEEMELSQSR